MSSPPPALGARARRGARPTPRGRRAVVFRHRPDHPAAQVEVRGEMVHWHHRAPMRPAGDGWLEARFELPVGVYDYKLRFSEGDWRLDPNNPRTRSRDGLRNNLVCIGGTDEPVLHAPAPPYLFGLDDGRVCVRAGLRRGHGDALVLRWDEGDGPRTTRMRQIAVEDEHLVFEAWVPGGGAVLEYLFFTASGAAIGAPGGAGQALRVEVAPLRPTGPTWWQDAVVYSIFVDRFRRTGGTWVSPNDTSREVTAGGDLRGVAEALPHLADLGVDALHLTPICVAGSPHRYDCIDPRRVDPALGGEAALRDLLAAAAARGIRVLLDVTVTHVHRDFFAFRDVRERGRESAYADWFFLHHWPFSEGPSPGYEHYMKGQWQEPLLRTDHPAVMDYLVETFVHWARVGVDGFRIDAAADIPPQLVERIIQAVRAINPEAAVFGEIIPGNGHCWIGGGLDAATDFVAQGALYDWLWRRRIDARRLGELWARRRAEAGPRWSRLVFTATHDQPRLRTLVDDPRRARLAHAAVLTGEGIPMLYYGDEVGLASTEPERGFEDAWPDRMCMPWSTEAWDADTHAFTRATLAARRRSVALRRGDSRPLDAGAAASAVLAVRRTAGDEVVDVFLNGSDDEQRLALPPLEAPLAGVPAVLLASSGATLDEGLVRLPPLSALVVARSGALARASDVAERAEIRRHARELVTLAVRQSSPLCPAPPTHLYVTVTEACNLRCAHCITDAPARTRGRTARELQPWVIDALREPLATARYLAFTHGGEALTSPRLFELLAALARARAGASHRCDVHLATNGMLLDRAMVDRLVTAGVTSIMVSLDGATAATNDRLRVGGRFDRIIDNLRTAVAWRARTGADLRLGVSSVLGRSSAGELEHLAELTMNLGLDWLKLEEMYPASQRARLERLPADEPRLAERVQTVGEALRRAGVVLVDHLDAPAGCRCTAPTDPRVAAFREADDFANRARFCPTRAAWDQACIDPDGRVRPISYAHEPIGSLADAPLDALWNGPAVVALRERSLAARAGACVPSPCCG